MAGYNLPSIQINDFIEIVKLQLLENNYRPIFGLGKGGIGKTESLGQLAKELNIGYIDIRLLLYSETDLKGIPYPNGEHTHTIWLQNNILPNAQRDGARGILVFDEITSCARSVRTAAYQLLNERKLGEYVLPDGWLVVCLGNGEEDGGDFNGMEGNFANRCSVYEIVSNVEAWKLWAMKNNINELVTAYVSFKPGDLHSYNPNNETDILFASPRSWKAVSDILNVNGYKRDDRLQNCRIMANLGQTVGHQFLAFCKFKERTINPRDILERGVNFQSDSQEIIHITIQSVVKLMCEKLDKDLKAGYYSEESFVWGANMFRWLFGLRKEYAVMGYKDFVNFNQALVARFCVSREINERCPELKTFITENSCIFS